MDERERGSLLPLLAMILLMATSLALAVGRLGEAAVARAQARTAADAAALAGAAQGRTAAVDTARDNGARVLGYRDLGREVEVTVEWGAARARARARTDGNRAIDGMTRPRG